MKKVLDSIIELLELFNSIKYKKIIVFGTGEGSGKVTKILDFISAEIAYYVDNNKKKQNGDFLDSKILPPDVLLKENKSEIVIVVASMFYEEIGNQLKEMGFIENIHYFYGMGKVQNKNLGTEIKNDFDPLELRQSFEKIFADSFNYTYAPLQVRKWIKLLENDSKTGFRIKKNLSLSKDYLGFTFCSNNLGLRGPADTNGKGVIFGTSFAMGFSVDNGANWYDRKFFSKRWLNLGLPVGSAEIKNLYRGCYRGDHSMALLLYFPNFWIYDKRYIKRRKSSLGLIEFMDWKMEYIDCVQLTLERYKQFKSNIRGGKFIILEHNGNEYLLDGCFSHFNPEDNIAILDEGLLNWKEILQEFKKVFIVRIPAKENTACKYVNNYYLDRQKDEHTKAWVYTKENLNKLGNAVFLEPDIFELDDYHPCDSHWNVKGNKKFSDYIVNILDEYDMND